jgi:hypothetical protein
VKEIIFEANISRFLDLARTNQKISIPLTTFFHLSSKKLWVAALANPGG